MTTALIVATALFLLFVAMAAGSGEGAGGNWVNVPDSPLPPACPVPPPAPQRVIHVVIQREQKSQNTSDFEI